MRLRDALVGIGVATIAVAAVAAFTSSSTAGASTLLLATCALAATVWATRRRALGPSSVAVRVDRVGGCALGPGQSIHAVRVDGRLLLVGSTPSSITRLDRRRDARRRRSRRRRSEPATITGLVLMCVAFGLGVDARGAQGDSTHQSTSFERRPDPDPAPAPDVQASTTRRPSSPETIQPPTVPSTGSGVVVWLAALALFPFAVMTVTSFVKISVVLSLLRTAMGTPQIPSDPVVAAIALALTTFVMAPVASEIADRLKQSGANLETATGAIAAAPAVIEPVRAFLERNARREEVAVFVELSGKDGREASRPDALQVLVPAFITSELRQAFVAGFLLFVPFLVIDLVVSNILMSMGMVMVSPATIAMPFKVLVFVLVDGWPLLMKGLALSYH